MVPPLDPALGWQLEQPASRHWPRASKYSPASGYALVAQLHQYVPKQALEVQLLKEAQVPVPEGVQGEPGQTCGQKE